MLKNYFPLMVFILVVSIFSIKLFHPTSSSSSPMIDQPLPDVIGFRQNDSTPVHPKSMLGKVWLLNVWASWCSVCREEHATLLEFSKRKIISVVGLNYKDTQGFQWLQRFGNPYEFVMTDMDGIVGIHFGMYGVPESFLIDPQGIIRYKHVGPLTQDIIEKEILPRISKLQS